MAASLATLSHINTSDGGEIEHRGSDKRRPRTLYAPSRLYDVDEVSIKP